MNKQNSCIFCHIVSGKIPCHKVYEDDHNLAFLDVNPLSVGHTLVIPKKHYATLIELAQEDLFPLMHSVQRIAEKLIPLCGASGFNLLQNNSSVAGQVIFHVHFHIIPRYPKDSLDKWPHTDAKAPYDLQALSEKIHPRFSV